MDAIDQHIILAKHLEKCGYERLWIAEHHNAPNLVSSATSLLIQHTLAHTKTMRIGSGGIMLPNHAPLIVAEQFGTLHKIYGNRVDLGLGRAPGTDMATASALRRNQHDGVYQFPEEVRQLLQYFGPETNQGYVKAIPAVGTDVPIYILGSSTDSAHVAASEGLPYVFAGHFAPDQMKEALEIYRERFEPSRHLEQPYIIVCLNTIVAETDAIAHHLATTQVQVFANILNGRMRKIQPPVEDLSTILSPRILTMSQQRVAQSLIGSDETVKEKIKNFLIEYGNINEIMAVSYIYDESAQHQSYARFKHIMDDLNQAKHITS
ncbi:LLM class flavin-dependent oxidoreductase [Staphylococcus felis]|uniref:LLM class flavin-dependent oxidoreductase n=1 Tax=Staphylococcus felis TaxID=46127 RepID=UPI001E55D011|nr:LLM class flavin-dependent oxidoreductase [Staphylococcus felis]